MRTDIHERLLQVHTVTPEDMRAVDYIQRGMEELKVCANALRENV